MAEPWIRVHADLISKPVIGRLGRTLSVSPYEAMGCLVTFWGNVSRHAKNGHVANYDDEQLETWAGWPIRRGQKRGAFANWLRQNHIDADGRVNEWDEYAGALESRREKERTRLRNKRHGVAQQPAPESNGVAQHLTDVGTRARERNETIRDETKELVVVGGADAARMLAVAANRGLAEHPTKPQPIPRIIATGGRTLEAAEEILAAGVPIKFAEAEVYELARTHRADGVLSSLTYFVAAVIRAWKAAEAQRESADWTPPATGAPVKNHAARSREPLDVRAELEAWAEEERAKELADKTATEAPAHG